MLVQCILKIWDHHIDCCPYGFPIADSESCTADSGYYLVYMCMQLKKSNAFIISNFILLELVIHLRAPKSYC